MKCDVCEREMRAPAGCTHAVCAECNTGRATRDQVRKIYLQVVSETSGFNDTKESWLGFMVGFRAYERMATKLGQNMTQQDIDRFRPVVKK